MMMVWFSVASHWTSVCESLPKAGTSLCFLPRRADLQDGCRSRVPGCWVGCHGLQGDDSVDRGRDTAEGVCCTDGE